MLLPQPVTHVLDVKIHRGLFFLFTPAHHFCSLQDGTASHSLGNNPTMLERVIVDSSKHGALSFP